MTIKKAVVLSGISWIWIVVVCMLGMGLGSRHVPGIPCRYGTLLTPAMTYGFYGGHFIVLTSITIIIYGIIGCVAMKQHRQIAAELSVLETVASNEHTHNADNNKVQIPDVNNRPGNQERKTGVVNTAFIPDRKNSSLVEDKILVNSDGISCSGDASINRRPGLKKEKPSLCGITDVMVGLGTSHSLDNIENFDKPNVYSDSLLESHERRLSVIRVGDQHEVIGSLQDVEPSFNSIMKAGPDDIADDMVMQNVGQSPESVCQNSELAYVYIDATPQAPLPDATPQAPPPGAIPQAPLPDAICQTPPPDSMHQASPPDATLQIPYPDVRVAKKTNEKQKGNKITKMIGLVLSVYLISYVPQFLVFPLFIYYSGYAIFVFDMFLSILWWTNAWANPVIYAWKMLEFRKAFKKILHLK